MSQSNQESCMTPVRQIKKVSFDEVPNAPIKDKCYKMNITVEIPKFEVDFDDEMREHETRLHRKK